MTDEMDENMKHDDDEDNVFFAGFDSLAELLQHMPAGPLRDNLNKLSLCVDAISSGPSVPYDRDANCEVYALYTPKDCAMHVKVYEKVYDEDGKVRAVTHTDTWTHDHDNGDVWISMERHVDSNGRILC